MTEDGLTSIKKILSGVALGCHLTERHATSTPPIFCKPTRCTNVAPIWQTNAQAALIDYDNEDAPKCHECFLRIVNACRVYLRVYGQAGQPWRPTIWRRHQKPKRLWILGIHVDRAQWHVLDSTSWQHLRINHNGILIGITLNLKVTLRTNCPQASPKAMPSKLVGRRRLVAGWSPYDDKSALLGSTLKSLAILCRAGTCAENANVQQKEHSSMCVCTFVLMQVCFFVCGHNIKRKTTPDFIIKKSTPCVFACPNIDDLKTVESGIFEDTQIIRAIGLTMNYVNLCEVCHL